MTEVDECLVPFFLSCVDTFLHGIGMAWREYQHNYDTHITQQSITATPETSC